MGIMDKAKQMRDKLADSTKVDEYIEKAEDKIQGATGHRFDDQIDKGSDMAKDTMKKGRKPEQQ